MSEWAHISLGEICETITVGHVGAMASEYVPEGVPFLRSQNVRSGRLDFSDVKYISNEFHQELRKSQLIAGDIVIVRTGLPGVAALVPDGLGEINCSDIVIARPGPAVDARFVCYSINATSGRFVAAHLVGAVQQHFNVGSARNLRLLLPPLSEQRAIADVVSALDDKIAVNERIAKFADELRRLKLANFIGAQSKQATRASLLELADFVNGRAFTKDATGTGRMVVRIAELNSGPGGSTVYNDIEVADKHLARPGDVLFAWSGSLTVARWYRSEAIVNQHIFKVVPHRGVPGWLVFDLLSRELPDFRSIAADKATTMGHIQRRHLDRQVSIPNRTALPELDAELGPLWDRALAAEMESLMLTELRDTLLPRLMSGEIRVRDAEKVVEEAT